MTLNEFLIVLHVVGTVLGVGAATFAEIHHTRFNSDNVITDDEHKTLAVTYTIMRFGLFLLVVSGFAFLLEFRLAEHVGALTSQSFWAKMTVVMVLVANALLLQMRVMPFAAGAALSLTSWYAALILGVIGKTDATYFEIMMYYGIAVILVGVVLRAIRKRFHPLNLV